MIIKENVTLYICQYCKKRMLIKGACENHEAKCFSNPANFRACSFCVHIEEIELQYEKDAYTLGDGMGAIPTTVTRKAKAFRCKLLDKIMYPYKAEKMDLPNKYPESFEGQNPMPKVGECKSFQMLGFL